MKANMVENQRNEEPWGTYQPGKNLNFYLFLTKIGLARGFLGKIIRKKWAQKSPGPTDVEVRGIRYRLFIRKDNVTDEKILLSSKVYDGPEIEQLSNSGKTFVDIGANIGYYSLALAKNGFDKVIAIEPNPETLRRLEFNVNANSFNRKIKIIPCCVGPGGVVDFYCSGNLGSASLHSEGIDAPPVQVESKPLLEIVNNEKIDSIDSMKVDIEGYEDQALIPFFEEAPEALWPKNLVLEHTSHEMWQTDVLKYLLNGKYQLIKKTRGNAILQKI